MLLRHLCHDLDCWPPTRERRYLHIVVLGFFMRKGTIDDGWGMKDKNKEK